MTGKNKQPLLPIRHNRLVAFVGSRLFFGLTLAIFVLQAGWIAFSNKFPLAFDEGYHFGIIKLYAHQWSPFFGSEPAGAAAYGDVTRDPSYLFHYIMSFPYRIFHALIPGFASGIIFLRLMDVALFALGVLVFRKVLLASGLSRSLTHLLLLGFVLLPVVPFMAANINYDNALFLLTGLAVLTGLWVAEGLRGGRLDTAAVIRLLALCAAASITKYTFLPLALGIVVFLGAYGTYRRIQYGPLTVTVPAKNWLTVGSVAALLVFGGLFIERYGLNTVRFHTPIPQCDKVLSVSTCQAYGPWARNYALAQVHPASALSLHGFLHFDRLWLGIMANSTFGVMNADQGGTVEQATPMLKVVLLVLSVFGTVAILFQVKRLRQLGLPLALFLTIGIFYGAVLLLHNYADFNHLGMPIAVQGRYLLPVLPLLAVIPLVGIATTLRNRPQLNAAIAMAAVAVMLFGGGVSAYLLRSDTSWYRPGSTFAHINTSLHDFLEHVTPSS